jgi:hypothetical protein
MFDTLVDRGVETRRAESERNEVAPPRPNPERLHAAVGVMVLDSPLGASLAPRVGFGYLPWPWLRVRALAFGLGSKPARASTMGQVSLDPRFVGGELALLTRRWWRVQPTLSVSAGKYWAQVRGEANTVTVEGQSITRSSPAASASLGLALDLGHGVACELSLGMLWLQNRIRIATQAEDVGSVGPASDFAGLMVNADF